MIIPFLGSGCPAGLRKMDWSLLLSFCCHSSIGRKTELALNCRISHWYLPGLLPKQNLTDSSRYSGEMESVIIPFLLPYILKIASTAEIRVSLKSVDISCTRHASSSNKECVWVILCHIQPITVGASISSALLYLQQQPECKRKMGHLDRGNRLQEIRYDYSPSAHRADHMSVGSQKGQQCRFYLSRIWIWLRTTQHSHAALGGFGALRECRLEEGPANWLSTCAKNLIPHRSPPPWRERESYYGTQAWSLPGSLGEISDRTPKVHRTGIVLKGERRPWEGRGIVKELSLNCKQGLVLSLPTALCMFRVALVGLGQGKGRCQVACQPRTESSLKTLWGEKAWAKVGKQLPV